MDIVFIVANAIIFTSSEVTDGEKNLLAGTLLFCLLFCLLFSCWQMITEFGQRLVHIYREQRGHETRARPQVVLGDRSGVLQNQIGYALSTAKDDLRSVPLYSLNGISQASTHKKVKSDFSTLMREVGSPLSLSLLHIARDAWRNPSDTEMKVTQVIVNGVAIASVHPASPKPEEKAGQKSFNFIAF
jgi:hypothetical protein